MFFFFGIAGKFINMGNKKADAWTERWMAGWICNTHDVFRRVGFSERNLRSPRVICMSGVDMILIQCKVSDDVECHCKNHCIMFRDVIFDASCL